MYLNSLFFYKNVNVLKFSNFFYVRGYLSSGANVWTPLERCAIVACRHLQALPQETSAAVLLQ